MSTVVIKNNLAVAVGDEGIKAKTIMLNRLATNYFSAVKNHFFKKKLTGIKNNIGKFSVVDIK